MQVIKKILSLSLLNASLLFLAACGNLATNEQNLTIEMWGVFKEPENVNEDGNATPKYYEFTFTGITLNGDEEVAFTPDDTETFKIINRPQIVYTEDVSDYEESEFTSATISFESTVSATGKYDSGDIRLSNPDLRVSDSFTVEKGKGLRFTVKILWQNTVIQDEDAETESFEEPEFDLAVESS